MSRWMVASVFLLGLCMGLVVDRVVPSVPSAHAAGAVAGTKCEWRIVRGGDYEDYIPTREEDGSLDGETKVLKGQFAHLRDQGWRLAHLTA